MSNGRHAAPGTTRTCPHCRAVILDSASMCPSCKRYLRFDPGAASRAAPSFSPLKVEGTIRHPADGDPWEYSVVLTIRNERGEEIGRHVVGVGAMHPGDQRAFTLAVDVYTAGGAPKPTGGTVSRPATIATGRTGSGR